MEIRQGYKQTELGIIPEEWEVKKLGECFEVIMGQSPSSKAYNEEKEGLPLVQGNADIRNNKVYPRMYTSEITKESYPNDLIMTVRAPVGYIYISDIHSCIGRGICAIRNGNKYLYYYLFKYKDRWERLAQGSTFTAITVKDIKELNIPIPPLKEQEKITEILSYYDEAIEQQELLIGKEKEFKKGMIQKIFSQEIRFKDDNGEDYPEWEEKKLEEFAFIFIGLVTTMTSNYVEKGVPLIRNSDIFSNKIRDKKELIKLNSVFVEQNKNRVFQEGDIVTVHTGDLGTSAIITKDLEGSIGFATLNTRILNKKYCNNLYLSHFLNSKKYKKYITRVKTGDGRDNLNLKDFVKSLIPIPPLKEQEKIANFLSDIDKKIELLENKLELLKNEKKGMMQKLLTGEVRV